MHFGSEENRNCNTLGRLYKKKLCSKAKLLISREPQPAVKQVPVGYFRAFTYHPLAFNPQTPNQYFSYQGGKMLQPNSMYSYPKPLTGQPGPPSSVYGQMPSSHIPQPPNTQSVPATITSPNAVPTQTTPQQTPTHSASVNPAASTTATQSQPTSNDVQPPTTVPAQFTSNPHVINNSPMRQMPYVPDPVNLQYITNVAPVPLQQVQFVPCMCPVAVSIGTGIPPDVVANKRSDDIQMPADYRDISIGEQSLSEER